MIILVTVLDHFLWLHCFSFCDTVDKALKKRGVTPVKGPPVLAF